MQRNSSSKVLIVVAVLLLVIGIGAVAFAVSRDTEPTQVTETLKDDSKGQATQQDAPSTSIEQNTTDMAVIIFTDDGFSQDSYTFPAGTVITVKNDSSMDMQFSSDDHPSHRDHTELNMKVLGAGESGTITPAGKGTYGFHDHINDQFKGTLIIE